MTDEKRKNSAPEKIYFPSRTDRVSYNDDLPDGEFGDDAEYLPDILPSRRER